MSIFWNNLIVNALEHEHYQIVVQRAMKLQAHDLLVEVVEIHYVIEDSEVQEVVILPFLPVVSLIGFV